MTIFAILLFVVTLCLIFTYTNGFQDGSSVAASAIGSRSLSPVQTAILVCVFEFLGALLGGSAVTDTIHSIIDCPCRTDLLPVLASGLSAAILWNFLTKIARLPSSSTHALVGGVLGSVYAASGWTHVVWGSPGAIYNATGIWRVILSLFVSPLVGFIGGWLVLTFALFLLSRASTSVSKPIKQLQWVTTAAMAFGHGANDTQKTMGIITLGLAAAGIPIEHGIPIWVRLLCGTVMALGVACMVPGIVRRVGSGIFNLRPLHGLSTQIASSSILVIGSATGGPVSATQVISSCVMGVGFAARKKGVHWLVAQEMIMAWFLTIPCAGTLAWVIHCSCFHCLMSFITAQ